jgi:hypothetical protein
MSVGLFLLTNLTATTDLPMLWLWMFLTGLGIGPTFSVLTTVIQSVVPFDKLGVATSNLTFFRQIGGTVGLAVVGTLFASEFQDLLIPELAKAGVPPEQAGQALQRPEVQQSLGAVGVDLGAVLAQLQLPPDLIAGIVSGVNSAFSLAIAHTFWFGLAATLLALIASVGLPDLRLRGLGREPQAGAAPQPTGIVTAAE